MMSADASTSRRDLLTTIVTALAAGVFVGASSSPAQAKLGISDTVQYIGSDGVPHTAKIFYNPGWPDGSKVQFVIDGVLDPRAPWNFYFTAANNFTYFAQCFSNSNHGVPFIWHFWRESNPNGPFQPANQIELYDNQKQKILLAIERTAGGVMFAVSAAP